jgi:hypothetical protein
MNKICIALKDSRSITVFLDKDSTQQLFDQFYEICSGNLQDNVVEVTTNDNCFESTLIRADEILYIQSREELDE